LRDRAGAARIKARITRARLGNFGDHKSVGHGVLELRIHFGPGYRVYLGLHGNDLIVLLCAGDKSGQQKDIRNALAYWAEYKSVI
jgi:putative addiction module killer protein